MMGMTIWIFALLVLVAAALAGWRQGAIRAALVFVSILFAALFASLVGNLLRPLLPHFGASNPITAWAIAPIIGFIVASIPVWVAAQYVHNRVEHFYKYRAGDLRLMLWSRLNARLGICLGLINGAAYFILLSFFIYNLAYWTKQSTPDAATPSLTVRLANRLGEGLQDSGFAQTASAVSSLSPEFYKLADLAGLLAQNPALGPRLAAYPGLTSLWRRDDLQSLVTDPSLTNALTAGTTLGEIIHLDSVKALLANKTLRQSVETAVTANLDDLTAYLRTGKSLKFGDEPILGTWVFNAGVTLAWLRQDQPKMGANEMYAIRALWSQAYAQTTVLLTGDNQVFVQNLPKFLPVTQPNQPQFQGEDWKGDWSREGANYTLHITLNGDKYLSATTDGVRLRIKDARNLLIFDHAN